MYGGDISDTFTDDEIKERFDSMKERYPNKDFDELVEITKSDLSEDAERLPGHGKW